MLDSPYKYIELSRDTNPETGRRHYKTPDCEFLPSVTTIIGSTGDPKDAEALRAWIDWVGEKKAIQIRDEAGNRGTVMHRRLEWYVKGIEKKVGSNHVQQQGSIMAKVIIGHGMKNMTRYWGSEISLWYPGLYAGSADLAGEWKGKPAIIDFKQANKKKTDDVVKGYKIQLVMYGLAHNEIYDTEIRTGVIMVCTVALEYQEFVVEGDEWDEYVEIAYDRIGMYYQTLDK